MEKPKAGHALPRAVLFDAYGTLFDVYSVGLLAEQLFPGQHYRPFWELTRAGLRYACKRLGLDLSAASEERLMNQYRHLSAFPETREVLQALKDRGVVTGILSNGDPGMLDIAVRSAGLEGLLDHVLSVDAVRQYKTHPEAYALGPQATGLAARQIAFVSCNSWDALGATWYGYPTLWVNRYALPFEELGTFPARTGHSLLDVLGFFPAA
ncbi:MAG: haloacid dehalogenase type II [Haliea sp.]|nr:MAG: haloacid dehalogenase type II [Haliea sp.]